MGKMRNLFKVAVITAFLAQSSIGHAQLPNAQFRCELTVPFSVQTNGNSASVTMKGNNYLLKYSKSWVGKNGDRWYELRNEFLILTTTFPYDNYFDLTTPSGEPIAFGNCNKLN